MAERRAVQCTECGHPFCARLVGEEYILSTNDGKCVCGNQQFAVVDNDVADGA